MKERSEFQATSSSTAHNSRRFALTASWCCRVESKSSQEAMQAFSNPSQRFRQALAGCSSSSPSLEHLIRLADRLPSTSSGQADLRNPDPVTRETSLHIAAKRGRVDVCEWLLEEDHDEQEVSRVRPVPHSRSSRCADASSARRTPQAIPSSTLPLPSGTPTSSISTSPATLSWSNGSTREA